MNKILSIICFLLPLSLAAQEKLVTTTKMIGIGYNSVQDTYLSPEHYGGMELRYLSHTERERAGICHDSIPSQESTNGKSRWTRLVINEGYFSYGKSRSKNGATLSGAYHFQYGVLRKWQLLADRLTLKGGVQAEFLGGFIYNTRNGNNPAQARALLDIGPVVSAKYALRNGNAGGKGRIIMAYEASCPLLGLTFSPNYGQSYYEIFNEGNYDRNIVPTTIVSMPSLRQQLTFTFCLSRMNLSVGYLGDYRQLQVNSLKQHVYSSMFMIGMTHSFYAGRRRL
ncbi:MAG: DUF3316 domain-containing protein [Bacteroidales bacterium]|nr:DUF3316 domain-containing protein [Bacteroidales bacterium]MCM1148215.1 DUF3316 domain-containing protein [Bacteroidales bacterium]MCM1206954.1 DUF3316 domain-containing protein [Bacillota bacterium]MCM1511208.1 DUF3316 domain-containing protein [Clostridium sp.]